MWSSFFSGQKMSQLFVLVFLGVYHWESKPIEFYFQAGSLLFIRVRSWNKQSASLLGNMYIPVYIWTYSCSKLYIQWSNMKNRYTLLYYAFFTLETKAVLIYSKIRLWRGRKGPVDFLCYIQNLLFPYNVIISVANLLYTYVFFHKTSI